jgi:S-adenosylmethionine:tRNA ribosyltransferase-isomerase
MRLSDFNYDLPEELIAQQPLERRDASRMLLVNRSEERWHDLQFSDFPSFVNPGDAVVLNNTKVFPARLIGEKAQSGGRVELFLVRELAPGIWEALVKPARRIGVGAVISFGGSSLRAEVLQVLEEGKRTLQLTCAGSLEKALDLVGQVPLPPYIKRPAGPSPEDSDRYQTVFAQRRGAIAAPTAGLHFTKEVLQQVTERQARVVEITLHVGYGTFEPVRVEDVSRHSVAAEAYEINEESAAVINASRQSGGRVIAVGTTATRALESSIDDDGNITPGRAVADLTITPGHTFRAVNALLTNFHLPQSSLLLLVAAFGGRELILRAYRHAVASSYRFYSYGDCMLII